MLDPGMAAVYACVWWSFSGFFSFKNPQTKPGVQPVSAGVGDISLGDHIWMSIQPYLDEADYPDAAQRLHQALESRGISTADADFVRDHVGAMVQVNIEL